MFYWAYKKELLQLCPWLCLTSRSHYNKWSSLGTIKALPKDIVEILYGPFFKRCVQFMNKFFFNVTPLNGAVGIYNLQRPSQIPCIWQCTHPTIKPGESYFYFISTCLTLKFQEAYYFLFSGKSKNVIFEMIVWYLCRWPPVLQQFFQRVKLCYYFA